MSLETFAGMNDPFAAGETGEDGEAEDFPTGQHRLKSKHPIDFLCVFDGLSSIYSIYSNWDHHGSTSRLYIVCTLHQFQELFADGQVWTTDLCDPAAAVRSAATRRLGPLLW